MNDFAPQAPAIPHPVDPATSASPAGAAKAEAVAPHLRLAGGYGDISVTLTYRWIPKAEDNYLAEVEAGRLGQVKPLAAGAVQPLVVQAGDWPGFRGPNRDSRLPGVKIATNWNQNP